MLCGTSFSLLLLGVIFRVGAVPRSNDSYKQSDTTAATWTFASDTTTYSAYQDLPSDIDTYTAYTKIMVSTKNETITWFYNGFSTVIGNNLPEVRAYSSQTCEAFKVTNLSNSSLRIDWQEVIQMTDPVKQLPISEFRNPLTGITVPVTTHFYNAASTWWISRNGTGVDLRVTYAGTGDVSRAHIKANVYNGQIILTHYEEMDGMSPSITTLLPIGSLADVRNTSISSVQSIGSYYGYFGNESIASSFGYPNGTVGETRIIGVINKGNEFGYQMGNESNQLFPVEWTNLKASLPGFFGENGKVSPNWTALFNESGPI